MEPDQQQWIFNEWSSSWPPIAESAPVDYSIIRSSPHSATSDLSSSSAQVSSNPPENLVLDLEMARSPWSSTDRIQTPPGLLSPRPVLYPDTNACSAHDPMTAAPTPPSDPYSAIQEQFCNAPWRHAGELEPKDPTTGRSVLHRLLEEFTNENKGRISECRLCNRTFTRADRAITHLRHKHLDHRPFWCGGACGAKGCPQRFHSQENMTPHVKPKMVSCPHCPYNCLRQNLKRHIQKYHSNQLGLSSQAFKFTTDLSF